MMRHILAIAVSLLLIAGALVAKAAPAPAAHPSVRVTGVLLLADGSPAKAKEIVAYPLDSGGKAFAINSLGKDGTMALWNPTATTDAAGKFALTVPSVKRIGKTDVSRFGLSTTRPAGGMVTVTVWGLVLTDGSEEMVFVHDPAAMPMLSNASGPVSVGFAEQSKDVGSLRMH